MSLKDLFKEQQYKNLSNSSISSLTASGVESAGYIEAYLEDRNRFIPLVDFSQPANFARFGSAEKYYFDSIRRVYQTYPYDGSKKEKIQWELSSSGLDLYLFENEYPRTTGFAVFSTSSLTATDTSTNYSVWGSYGAAGSGTYEYVSFNGGPHAGEGSAVHIDPDTGEAHYREKANLYDLSKNRECNLKIGGDDGNTIEFWLKKAAFNTNATQTEVIFDIFTTSSISSSLDYGRMTVEVSGHGAGTNTLSPFYVTYLSGTSGISKQNIGASITTSSVADDNWHHYSFRFKNEGSNTSVDLFVDGDFNHNIKTGTTTDYVSGTLVGTIGALATEPSGTHAGSPQAGEGWGKLSGSVDELRFWKVWRNSQQIQTRWFDQVGGGTNTDDANTNLGLYYKFNEGITLTSSTDSVVLDYSGRISNGTWVGYSSLFSRDTGSAINETNLTNFSGSEFRDPILYAYHPEVQSFLSDKRKEGKEYDYGNPSTIYYSLPSWLIEEHDANDPDGEGIISNSLWNLTQILSSYFDNAANLMKSLPDLAQTEYVSGSQKPIPFMNRILESKGFVAPELFNAIDALENFENRDNNSIYTEKISDIKNIIYRNIYNNLTFINKSKGTEKSFRNLIRCFGIDDKIYKLNYYSNNVDYILEDNYRSVADKFKLVDFNTLLHTNAVVYQYSSSLNSNSTTFISASKDFTPATSQEAGLPFSVEANLIFPNRVDISDYHTLVSNDPTFRNNYPLFLTASMFGMHTAIDSTPAETTWNTNDFANFVVKAVKPSLFSNKAKFVLTGTAAGFIPELTSSFIDDIYADTDWSFLVSLYPEKFPNVNEVSGAAADESGYIVEFTGINKVLDTVINEFTLTGTLAADEATKFLASPKRVFVGSHRDNFTGSVLQQTDIKFNTIRVWQNKLTAKDLSVHASDPNNYSIKNPEQNAYLFNTKINKVYVPNKETMLLHWNFNNVTGSDASGEFIVDDLTSGSSTQINRYGFLTNLSNKQFTGRGEDFAASSTAVVSIDDFVVAKPNLPEVLSSENTIKVLSNDDIYFTRDSRPTFFDLYVEKSPYQNISEEMLKFMSTVVDFNNLIGSAVDRYRGEYKALKMLRQLFFQRMDTPNVDKYIEYFKWFDLAVSAMIQKLAPMSSGLNDRPLRNIIESHILERNKYQSKFPTYEFKQTDPEARLFGVNELTYPWKEGHAPLSFAASDQDDNCLWLKERAERTGSISSGDINVDSDRQEILDVINNLNNATPPNLSGSDGTYQGSTYALRRFARPYKINAVKQSDIHGGSNGYDNKKVGFWDAIRKRPTPSEPGEGGLISIEPPDSSLEEFKDCDDNLILNKGKRRFSFSAGTAIDGAENFSDVFKGQLIFPFSLYSSSVTDNPAMADLEDFKANLAVTNLHHDSYGPDRDVPMQGPFTEKYVGGRSYRHVMSNLTPNNTTPLVEGQRLEGWRLTGSVEGNLDLTNVSVHNPKSVFLREEYAKRPVNIKNIQQLTGASDSTGIHPESSTKIGNYTNTYEIVMTNGRSLNNRYLVESDGFLSTTTPDSLFVSGVIDFPLPRRDLTGSNKAIIVNRFSSPGDPATMGEGMLDTAAAEFSVYNALPFRNLSVRLPLQELLTDHANQFGLFSDQFTVAAFARAGKDYAAVGGSSSINDPGADLDYIGTGSFHKVNRNGRKQPKYSNEFTGDTGTISTNPVFDNFFVQHQIPQTDVQYSWITASLINTYTGSALFGFEQPDFSNASLASTDLTFVSASDSGSLNIKVDFAGLNTLVIDNVLSASNLLSSSDYYNDDIESLDDALTTNAVISHRGGPAGGSNWKLYRKDGHPIVRAHRVENRISFLNEKIIFENDSPALEVTIDSVIEPPITSKYKKITHVVVDRESGDEVAIDHTYMNNIRYFTDHTLDNLDLDAKLLDPQRNKKADQQMLDIINYYLYQANDFADAPELNPISGLVKLITRETIFPREQNTYLSTHRQRSDFLSFIWRDDIKVRKQKGSQDPIVKNLSLDSTPYGFLDITSMSNARTGGGSISASIFPLDARGDVPNTIVPGEDKVDSMEDLTQQPFETCNIAIIRPNNICGQFPGIFTGASFITPSTTGEQLPTVLFSTTATDGAGILQNAILPFSWYNKFVNRIDLRIDEGFVRGYSTLVPQYNRRFAGALPEDGTLRIYSASTPEQAVPRSGVEYKFGDTKWEAGEQSGKSPFYDSYSDYIEDIKRAGKDFSLIPEFRISEHMDFYLNKAENGFLTAPDTAFELTGTVVSSSANEEFAKVYSNSDFLKTFAVVNDFYGAQTTPSKITLSAEALIKFLPYSGFYPADRTVELSKLFFQSYSASVNITGSFTNFDSTTITAGDTIIGQTAGGMYPIWKPLFAPGILFNSIKSGIAVDYPVHTSNVQLDTRGVAGNYNRTMNGQFLENIPRIATDFDFRVPFEALLNPEGHLNQFIVSSEPHPTAAFGATPHQKTGSSEGQGTQRMSASLAAPGKLNYKLAMNNFLASTIDFFKPGGNLTTIASKPDTNTDGFGVNFDSTKEYRMRVVCYNGIRSTFEELSASINAGASDNPAATFQNPEIVPSYRINPASCVMYRQDGLNVQADMYGAAFGPPCDSSGSLSMDRSGLTDTQATTPLYGTASFEPFTPPYYDGYSHIEFIFRPEDADIFQPEDLSIPAILSNVEQNGFGFKRFVTQHVPGLGFDDLGNSSVATKNRMQLTSSINLSVIENASVDFDAFGNPQVIKKGGDTSNVLTIQPKWETPILDFKDVAATLPVSGSGSIAKGMWHQYGVKPSGSNGIFLQIQNIADSEKTNIAKTGSLADLLGFDTNPRKLGQVAESKKISEAIVAIPFFKDFSGNIKKFNLNKKAVAVAEEIVAKKEAGLQPDISAEKPDIAIIDMVSKMKKFIVPPHFDFVRNKDVVDPFAMFIFEFEVSLTEKDLTDIWQNLEPTVARSFQKSEASLPVDIFSPQDVGAATGADGLLPGEVNLGKQYALMEIFPENTQWMVFKIKQRSAFNYFAKTADSSDDSNFKFDFGFGSNGESTSITPDYSYNWPFDFFSLIELAKIDANLEMTPTDFLKKVEIENKVVDNSVAGVPITSEKAQALTPKPNDLQIAPSIPDTTGIGFDGGSN